MSTLRLTTISNQGGTASVPSETVINGSAKAWVNFNGTGTVAIRGSFNVSSITDNGTGDYTLNFTNAIADTNYSVALGGRLTIDGSTSLRLLISSSSTAMLTTSLRLNSVNAPDTAYVDPVTYCVSIFR